MDSSLEKMYPVCLIPLVSKMSCNKSDTPQGLATLPSGQKSVGKPFLTSLDFRTTGGLPAKKGDDRTQFELHHTCVNFIIGLNQCNNDVYRVTSRQFLQEFFQLDDKYFMSCLHAFLQQLSSLHMFVRVERPYGSKRFVMGYMKCDRVFSFDGIFNVLSKRLNLVPGKLLQADDYESYELRNEFLGRTHYERAVDKYNCFGVPLLHAAIMRDDWTAIDALLRGGDDPNEVNDKGMNALQSITKNCDCDSLSLFCRILGMITDVNAVDKYGCTALMNVLNYDYPEGNEGFATTLMKHHEIDVNIRDNLGNTALHYAVEYRRRRDIHKLLEFDCLEINATNSSGYTPLRYANTFYLELEGPDIIKILEDHGAKEY